MRGLLAAFGLMAAAPAMGAEQDLKPFRFLNFVAGEVIPHAMLKGCGKKPDVVCPYPLMRISTVYVSMVVTTHNYKLSTLYLDAHPNSYGDLLRAFTAKYGEPCEATIAVWKNALGVELENPTFRWCFSSGKLFFSKFGAQIDKMGILYEDVNRAPDPEPVINF